MRKGSKVTIWMSDKEKRELDAKKKKTLREHLLSDVGIEADPRLRGRPQVESDATKNLMGFYDKLAQNRRKMVKSELLRANRRGLSEDVRKRMITGDDWVWRDEVCKNCGFEYRTAMATESVCPQCSHVNKRVRTPTELELGEPEILNKFEYGEEPGYEAQRTGNLSEGYTPHENPASANQLMGGGVADRAVVSWDMSRFKFGKTRNDLVEEDE